MVTELGPLLAVLVLIEWCTLEEAEGIRKELTSREIPHTIAACLDQLTTALERVRRPRGDYEVGR